GVGLPGGARTQLGGGVGVEVAVAAAAGAERHVHVDPEPALAHPGQGGGRKRAVGGNRVAFRRWRGHGPSLTGVSDALVRVATEPGVTTLTLDSPHNRNALSTPLLAELREALAAAVADPSVRVVVLDHAGPAFCSGIDLTEAEAARRCGEQPVAALGDALADLWECPKPVVVRMAG